MGWRLADFPLNSRTRCGAVRNVRSDVIVVPVYQDHPQTLGIFAQSIAALRINQPEVNRRYNAVLYTDGMNSNQSRCGNINNLNLLITSQGRQQQYSKSSSHSFSYTTATGNMQSSSLKTEKQLFSTAPTLLILPLVSQSSIVSKLMKLFLWSYFL